MKRDDIEECICPECGDSYCLWAGGPDGIVCRSCGAELDESDFLDNDEGDDDDRDDDDGEGGWL